MKLSEKADKKSLTVNVIWLNDHRYESLDIDKIASNI